MTALRAGRLDLSSGKTQVAQGPKLSSHFLGARPRESGRDAGRQGARAHGAGFRSVDARRTEAGRTSRARAERGGWATTGLPAHWRGSEQQSRIDPAQPADEAARIASARRSRGHATGEADADPNIPYEGSAVSPSSAGGSSAIGVVGHFPRWRCCGAGACRH